MNETSVKLFVIDLTYQQPLSEIDDCIPSHVTYLEKGYADGIFIASGRKYPRTGGIILATADSLATIQKRAMSDPFIVRGLASVSITEFHPSMGAPTVLTALGQQRIFGIPDTTS